MSANFYELLKYAATGLASPDMTYFDRMSASALMGGAVQTLTGQPPLSFKSNGKPLISWSMKGNGQQSGTPSPDNIIMPDFCGERTRNLLDIKDGTQTINNVVWTAYHGTITGQGTTTAAAASDAVIIYDGTFTRSGNYTKYCRIQASKSIKPPAGTYTFSANADPSSNDVVALIVGDNDTYYANSTARKIAVGETFSVNGDEYVMLVVSSSTSKSQYNFADIMLNLGSAALPYEPYGYKIPITCAGQTVPVYLAKTQTVRRVKKLVLTGGEEFGRNSSTSTYSLDVDCMGKFGILTALSSHYLGVGNVSAFASMTDKAVCERSNGEQIWIRDTDRTSVSDFKSYLAAQYAAGTPVVVWYVLAEPETAIVNEPLCKIGDYADELNSADAGVTIPTVKGQNTLTVETDLQPSEMTIMYRK